MAKILIAVIIAAAIAPTQTAELGTRIVAGLYPIMEKGLVLALVIFGILVILGVKKF